jgi:hypothetical protein
MMGVARRPLTVGFWAVLYFFEKTGRLLNLAIPIQFRVFDLDGELWILFPLIYFLFSAAIVCFQTKKDTKVERLTLVGV